MLKDIQKTATGFNIKKSSQQIEKEARDQRIIDKKINPKTNPTNKDVMEMLIDIADRQAEILEMLNTK